MVKLFSELVKRERILSTGLGARAMADMGEGRGSTLRRAQGSPTACHVTVKGGQKMRWKNVFLSVKSLV
jgi:hypothetical protein